MRWTDGGLATTLQAHGLACHTPVEPWLATHPAAIRSAHAAFVDAGAEILLSATFRALPHATDGWDEAMTGAVRLAREAAGDRAEVWLTLGPPARTGEAGIADSRAAVSHGVALGVDGVLLETRVDPDAALATVAAVRPLVDGLLVVSGVPRADGRLLVGAEPGPWLDALFEAGVDGAGFNCGEGPRPVRAAAERVGPRPGLWLAPAGGARAETLAVLEALRDVATWLGGCCGVDPATLAEAVHRGR